MDVSSEIEGNLSGPEDDVLFENGYGGWWIKILRSDIEEVTSSKILG